MAKSVSSIEDILAALPRVQETVRKEIAARRAAGETIVSDTSDGIRERIVGRRRALEASVRKNAGRKSAA